MHFHLAKWSFLYWWQNRIQTVGWGGGFARSSRPLDKEIRGEGARCPKIYFSALRATVWSKIKGGKALSWIRHCGGKISPFNYLSPFSLHPIDGPVLSNLGCFKPWGTTPVLYGKAPFKGRTVFPFIYHFWQRKVPFCGKPSIWVFLSFYMPFNKWKWYNHKMRRFKIF